jgi:hypothetical protein
MAQNTKRICIHAELNTLLKIDKIELIKEFVALKKRE